MIKLLDHINQEHSGNKAAFARSIKKLNGEAFHPNNISKLVNAKNPYYIQDGKIFQISYEIK